ncbi:hypothetical protein [Flavobacterium sp. N3904]|uniref:hypothetical protein n=1 Tax=Flavobacterium sp. N3904 TaxID=2986835 RepID=UPI0022258F4D|nr:hypothetical protein [Flavobacterium sp. N3904]
MKFSKIIKELEEEEIRLIDVLSIDPIEDYNSEDLKSLYVNVIDKEGYIAALKENMKQLSKKVFEASKVEVQYWAYCPYNVYKLTYKSRLKDTILNDNNDMFDETNFIDSEISTLNLLSKSDYLNFYHPDLKKPIVKKLRFLDVRKEELNIHLKEELIDLSETTGEEKIVFLHKLGVLDFLKKQSPYNTSTNKLAILLSAITGVSSTTLQPYLNPIYSPESSQTKNPLKKINVIERVEKKLSII